MWVILLTGAAAAVACALVGTFLVLRRMSLLGDAISHAVLPGIVIAFLLTNSVSSLPVVLGAGAFGLFTVFLIETLRRTRRIKEDAAIAVVFPALFALGVLLLAQYAEHKDLDQDCVLYGEIAYAPLDTIAIGGLEIARPLLMLGIAALLNLLFVVVLHKELELATFDAALAATLGISPVVLHYLLMGVVSLTTVASFDSVGAILVVAFLVVPAAAAHLLTDRLSVMLLLAALIGVACSTAGYFLARAVDASIAGSMATAMGAAFLLAWLFAPREGIFGRLIRRRRTRESFARALILSRLDRAPAALDAVARDLAWPRRRVRTVVDVLLRDGLVAREEKSLRPTAAGLAFVQAVVD
ncbi:MAG: metal ABC transporter permease [Planctomycetota bacterium]|jgi:manganese/zinc/iron transport system permease protein